MEFLTGFESTKLCCKCGQDTDVLEGTKHLEKFREDLDLVVATNIRTIRYPIPWHRIEKEQDHFDWSWTDQALGHAQKLGLELIVDPLHHISYPGWLLGGFANTNFPWFYERFVERFADRYPWITKYTLFNEPTATVVLCSYAGRWCPHLHSHRDFVGMMLNVARAICRCAGMLDKKIPGVQYYHVDTAEDHKSLDPSSRDWSRYCNRRKFLAEDLILGRVDSAHPLYGYLLNNGASAEELAWFRRNATRIDIRGLDYYQHSEMEWHNYNQLYTPSSHPTGLYDIALQYVERYRYPMMLTETNTRGTVFERITIKKFVLGHCEKLERQLNFSGFGWFPFIDSTDWDSELTCCNRNVDPQGIYWLGPDREERHASILSEFYAKLAAGEITSSDLPAYRFELRQDDPRKYLVKLMEHFDWQDTGEERRTA